MCKCSLLILLYFCDWYPIMFDSAYAKKRIFAIFGNFEHVYVNGFVRNFNLPMLWWFFEILISFDFLRDSFGKWKKCSISMFLNQNVWCICYIVLQLVSVLYSHSYILQLISTAKTINKRKNDEKTIRVCNWYLQLFIIDIVVFLRLVSNHVWFSIRKNAHFRYFWQFWACIR